MEKVIISDYQNQGFTPSIIVNISDKPFWYASYGTYFYAHNFDNYDLTDDELKISDDYYKQLSLSRIISQSQGSSDYRAINPNTIAFALHSGFYWRPPEDIYQQNISGSSNGNIYSGTDINLNQPEVYIETEKRKMFTTSYFNNLSDATKLDLIRYSLPFYVFPDGRVVLNLSCKLQASVKSGIKTGQFIL